MTTQEKLEKWKQRIWSWFTNGEEKLKEIEATKDFEEVQKHARRWYEKGRIRIDAILKEMEEEIKRLGT